MNFAHCTLEIDLSKIRENYRILANICKNSHIGAVVKANSYGLGAEKIAPILQQQENCQIFFVSSVDEGINLRKVINNQANIFVLNGVFYNDVKEFSEHQLIPVLNNLEQIEIWQKFAISKEQNLPCLLHIDTGMNRLGIGSIEVEQLINKQNLLQNLDLQYIVSHLSVSEELDNPYNFEQLTRFKHYLQYFPNIKASLANSSSIFLGPEYHFELVRPGAALYGLNPINGPSPMHNPIRLTAPIIQLQELVEGHHISYGKTFTTNRSSLIATLPLGYADGYSRAFSNRGEVFIDDHCAPVVGRVSMDLITIDVTDVPRNKVFLGKEVEIIGNHCTIDRLANIIGTISYEMLTKLGSRYKRTYIH